MCVQGAWKFESDSYATIQELIVAHMKSASPITKKSGALIKQPIVREPWELNNDDIELGQKLGNVSTPGLRA